MSGPDYASTRSVRRHRAVVSGAVLLGLAVRLVYAATTAGTNDVFHFWDFAGAEHVWGPIGMYAHPPYVLPPYNHPPLTGWLLGAVNATTRTGLPFRFVLRAVPSLCDVISALLVFHLLRHRGSLRTATVAGCVVALSPVLVIVSGYHGNTDPVFGALVLASFAVLVRHRPVTPWYGALAGLLWAASVSVKLVPVVTLPLLLVLAWRRGRRALLAFAGGAALIFAAFWLPVALTVWQPFRAGVLQYSGYYGGDPNGHSQWGLVEFLYAVGVGPAGSAVLAGPGRYVIALLAAGLPVLVAVRRPELDTVAFGLSLCTFLLLSPAGATQYLAWAAVPALLIGAWVGTAYNVAAGALLIQTYDHWNGDKPPWQWDRAVARYWTSGETWAAGGVWLVLLAVVVAGLAARQVSRPTTRFVHQDHQRSDDVLTG